MTSQDFKPSTTEGLKDRVVGAVKEGAGHITHSANLINEGRSQKDLGKQETIAAKGANVNPIHEGTYRDTDKDLRKDRAELNQKIHEDIVKSEKAEAKRDKHIKEGKVEKLRDDNRKVERRQEKLEKHQRELEAKHGVPIEHKIGNREVIMEH